MSRPTPQRKSRPSYDDHWSEEQYQQEPLPRHARRQSSYPPPRVQRYWWEEEEWLEDEPPQLERRRRHGNEQRDPRGTPPLSRNQYRKEYEQSDPYAQPYPNRMRKQTEVNQRPYGNYEDRPFPTSPRSRQQATPFETHPYYEQAPRQKADSFYQQPRAQRPLQPRSRIYEYQTEQEHLKKNAFRKMGSFFYNLLFYSVTIGVLLMSVMFAFSDKGDASIFGYRFYNVLTNSMAPSEDSSKGGFYSGDMVLVQMASSSDVQKGDIITYRVGDGSRYLTHRLVDRLDELNGEPGDYLITKGDMNKANDPPIQADRVIGKVIFSIPRLGTFIEFFRENLWLSCLLLVTLFAFLVVLKAYLFSEETRKRQTSTRYNHDFKRNRVI